MSISLNVLNHLGINLYSNIPAVLSEVVANAWDADAKSVRINIDSEEHTITIEDDGEGMTKDDINNRYLTVGYNKRVATGSTSTSGRPVMGRKGIGKLSVFSIAQVVDVYTAKAGQKNGFRLDVDEIKELVETQSQDTKYKPEQLPQSDIDTNCPQQGTLLILKDIDRSLNKTAAFLRKRLARRFTVIGEEHDFKLFLNDEEITLKDRQLYENLEYIWYNDEGTEGKTDYSQFAKKMEHGSATRIDNKIVVVDSVNPNKLHTFRVNGWIGTVKERKHLEDKEDNAIVIYAHGKLVHENILNNISEGGFYEKYLVGEIEADFLDSDDEQDIVTSSRQEVKEDDPRFRALIEWVWDVLKKIQREWVVKRQERSVELATSASPALKAWYKELKGDNKKIAQTLFAKIESLHLGNVMSKGELYKASLLAFERMALNSTLSILENTDPSNFLAIIQLFDNIAEIEAVLYHDIVKGRMNVLTHFETLLPEAAEKVLQQHLFKNIWLLNPAWERAATNLQIETTVEKAFDVISDKLDEEEKKGRIDIKYRSAAGKHVIIELKKYDRKVSVNDLSAQLDKYISATQKILREHFPAESDNVEAIVILGSPPKHRDPKIAIRMLAEDGIKFLTYDEIISDAKQAYTEYFEANKKVGRIQETIDAINIELGL